MRCSRCRGAGTLACSPHCESCQGAGAISEAKRDEIAARYRPAFQPVAQGGARVTSALLGAFFLVQALGVLLGGPTSLMHTSGAGLVALGAYTPSLVDAGEWWRLLTAGFVHHNLLHLMFNVSALLTLGRLLEAELGASRFWIAFSLSVLGGFAADYLLRPYPVLSGGASGGVFGLIGLGLVAAHLSGRTLEKEYFVRWLVGGIPATVLMGANHYAHGGGFVVGTLLAWLWASSWARTQWAERGLRGVAVVLLALVLLGEVQVGLRLLRAPAAQRLTQPRTSQLRRAVARHGYPRQRLGPGPGYTSVAGVAPAEAYA